jgi:hypothetical protein
VSGLAKDITPDESQSGYQPTTPYSCTLLGGFWTSLVQQLPSLERLNSDNAANASALAVAVVLCPRPAAAPQLHLSTCADALGSSSCKMLKAMVATWNLQDTPVTVIGMNGEDYGGSTEDGGEVYDDDC